MIARRVALALAVAGAALMLAEALPSPPASAANGARCYRQVSGVYRCVFPTDGRPAVVMVRAYEDGAARAVPLPPGGRR